MNLVSAGALGGVGQGMGQLGQTILQATMANEQLKHQDKVLDAHKEDTAARNKYYEAMGFKRAAHGELSDDSALNDFQNFIMRPMTMKPAGMPTAGSQDITQVARMLPNEQQSFQAPSAMALAKPY